MHHRLRYRQPVGALGRVVTHHRAHENAVIHSARQTVKLSHAITAILGEQVLVAVGCTGCVTANRWGCWDVSSRITVPMRMHRTNHYDNQSIGN